MEMTKDTLYLDQARYVAIANAIRTCIQLLELWTLRHTPYPVGTGEDVRHEERCGGDGEAQ